MSTIPPVARGSSRRGVWIPVAGVAAAILLLTTGVPELRATEIGGGPPGISVGSSPHLAVPSPDTILPTDTIRLAPVEVTVLRALTPLSAAPMAVSILDERALRSGRSGTFLEEALQGLPGVQVQNRFNPAVGERISIRGFGARAQFGVRGVRVVVDGIPATLPDGQSTLEHIDLGSIGRVEALRGPASALFGNASGGVLSFHTASPGDAPVGVEAELVFGSHGHRKGQATATGTLGDTGYLLSLSQLSWDGYRTDPNSEVGATYGAADRLGLNARAVRPLAGGELAATLNLMDLDAENPGSLPSDRREDPDRPAWGFNIVQGASKQVRQGQGGLRWTADGGTLDWDISLFAVRREVVNPIPSDIIDLNRDAGGLRIQTGRNEATGWGPLRWYAGVEAELQQDDRLNFGNSQGQRGEMTLDQAERVRSLGLFVQGVAPLPADGDLMVGLRHDRHSFRARDRFPRDEADPSGTGDRTMDAVSPSVGAQVPLSNRVNLFASVGTVFETPSTTELANRPDGAGGFNPELEPQRGTSGELGVRGRFGLASSWEVAVYRTHLRNELVPFEVPDTPGRTFFRNAGSSRYQGAEVTVSTGSPIPGFRTDLSYTWTDARFRSFELEGEAMGGNRVPGLAPHRGRLAVHWAPEPYFAELSGTYSHRIPVNDDNSQHAPSHTLVEVRGGMRGLEIGNVTVQPWLAVTNLLDRHHITSVTVNAFGSRYYEPGPGRSLQAGLRTRF
jgi:iron complex outermembrane recepter protein